jgi:hypothetical protein
VASVERTFRVLKQVNKYYLSTLAQEHVSATLNINCDFERKLDLLSVLNAFSEKDSRKAFIK